MNPADRRIRILLVDDHALFREGIREILKNYSDLEIVGEADDSNCALSMVAETRPDVVLLDVGIPGHHVTVTVAKIASLSPETRVVILTMYDEPQLVRDLLAAGVSGYLLKNTTRLELVSVIRKTYAMERTVTVSLSRDTLTQVNSAPANTLSPRELDILRLVSMANSNMQIARELALTEATVKRHIRKIFIKLGAVSRIDAVNKAIHASLLPARSTAPRASQADDSSADMTPMT